MTDEAEDCGPSDGYSNRSRASSIISTGTKTSVGTFLTTPFNPQALPSSPSLDPSTSTADGNVLDILLGRRNFRISARPGSVLSISSFDVPAPPYSEAINSPAVPLEALQTGDQPATPQYGWRGGEYAPPGPTPRPRRSRVLIRPSTAEIDEVINPNFFGARDDGDNASIGSTPDPLSRPESPREASANAISAHYTGVVRTIDTRYREDIARLEGNHRAELEALSSAQQAELDALRTELEATAERSLAATRNEIDGVYRGEFAKMRQEQFELQTAQTALERERQRLEEKADVLVAQVQVMAKAEQEAAALHTSEIAKLVQEKEELHKYAYERERVARNEVEDMWENRWKDRMNLAKEQDTKANREFDCWFAEIESRWPGSGDLVRDAVKVRVKTSEEDRKTKRGRKWPSLGSNSAKEGDTA